MRDIFTQLVSKESISALGIRADARARFEDVTTVMLLARSVGISKIFVIVGEETTTDQGEELVIDQSLELNLK